MTASRKVEPGEQPSNALGPTLDAISKMAALCIAFVYVSGFLITSLNDFRYGFSEMNPFRPRILAAGGWLLVFIAIPIELVRLLIPLWKPQEPIWYRPVPLLYAYYVETCFILMWFGPPLTLFNFDDLSGLPHVATWKILVPVTAFVVGSVALVIFSEKIPKPVKAGIALALAGYFLWQVIDQLSVEKLFEWNALQLWFMAVGTFALAEMKSRAWKFQLGYWPRGVVLYLGALSIFATTYYPHIKASYGGGAAIPVEVTFTKDAPAFPNQLVSCLLIDETDSGFYLTAKGEQHATFVPRSSAAMIHFAEASEPSIFTSKPK
jgi:hypothetical protein